MPAGSNSRTGGAGTQQMPIGGFTLARLEVVLEQVCRAMDDPHVVLRVDRDTDRRPSTQWFGSGFGQNGSTSKSGIWLAPAVASASTAPERP